MIGVSDDEKLLYDAQRAVERLLISTRNKEWLTDAELGEIIKESEGTLSTLNRRLFT